MAICMCHKFISLFSGRIKTYWMIYIMMHRKRHSNIHTINRTGRGIDQMLHLIMPAHFKYIQKTNYI